MSPMPMIPTMIVDLSRVLALGMARSFAVFDILSLSVGAYSLLSRVSILTRSLYTIGSSSTREVPPLHAEYIHPPLQDANR